MGDLTGTGCIAESTILRSTRNGFPSLLAAFRLALLIGEARLVLSPIKLLQPDATGWRYPPAQ
jgi:hypothetical protein